jgi:hypothetical protein
MNATGERQVIRCGGWRYAFHTGIVQTWVVRNFSYAPMNCKRVAFDGLHSMSIAVIPRRKEVWVLLKTARFERR